MRLRCEGLRVHTRPTLMSWIAWESRVTFGCLDFPVRKAKGWTAGPARTFYTQVSCPGVLYEPVGGFGQPPVTSAGKGVSSSAGSQKT